MKEKMGWDDGFGSSNYDVEERILVGNMKAITRLDDEKLTEDVALTNEKGLQYQLYFRNLFNITRVGTDDADDLYLTIFGKQYEILGMGASSITVVTSQEFPLKMGESAVVGGKTFTVEDLSSTAARINGETITAGNSKKINGLRVKVKENSIFYNENFPESASLTLQIGEDIQKTYTSGEEYIGQDQKNPLWTWNISLTTGAASYIGVSYAANIDKQKAPVAGDTIKYVGGAYMFPDNYGQVKLDGITDVSYEDLTISFESEDLYIDDDDSDVMTSGAKVIVIQGEDTDTIATGGKETDKIYIYYNTTSNLVQTYFRDWDNDYTPSGRMRLANASALNLTAVTAGANAIVATVTIGDTNLNVRMNVTGNATAGTAIPYLQIENTDDSNAVVLKSKIGKASGSGIGAGAGTFEQFGDDAVSTATTADAVFYGTDVSTKAYNYMDYYGIKIAEGDTVKSQVEADEIILSVPTDQVYAKVSVTVGGESSTETGVLLAKDTETSAISGKNLIVVGGSAINAIAADLLNGAFRGDAFTAATDIGAGEFLIQSFNREGKTALLVAGYNAADTEKGVRYLLNKDVDTAVGKKYKGTSETQAVLV
jgi:hypothetical protein